MDILYAFASFLSLVLVIYFYLYFLVYNSKPFNNKKLLPPGSKGWPVIGEGFELFAAGKKGHPQNFILDRMSKFSSLIFTTCLMQEDVAVLCGPQGNKFLFSNEKRLTRSWLPPSLYKIFPGSMNKYRKSVFINVFKMEALQQYVPIMDGVAQRYFETKWYGKKEIMGYEVSRTFTFDLACKLFLSIDDPERLRYLFGPFEAIGRGFYSMPVNLPMTPLRKAINAAKFIRNEIIAIAKQRKIDLDKGKATPTQDILSRLILYRDENGEFLEEHEIAYLIQGLQTGGHESVSSTCSSLIKFLAELPEIYNGVYKEQIEIAKSKAPGEPLGWHDLSKMKYSWKVACEVLRLTQLSGGFRQVTTDFMYEGYSIPKGCKLHWTGHSTHKNPEYFPQPEKFDPSRFEGNGPEPSTFMPFGGGAQMCPGREFARLAILVFMHHLVTKFKWVKIFPDEQIVFNPQPKPTKGLPIRIYPHKL